MKKLSLLLCGALLSIGVAASAGPIVAANAEGEASALQTLVNKYIGSEGKYTKKTTIGLNDATREDYKQHFHQGLNESKRTTYYNGNRLLLAAENGQVRVNDGSYYYADSKVARQHATEAMTETVDWTKLSADDFVQKSDATCLEDAYVTLKTFAVDNYFDGWTWSDSDKVYYLDVDPNTAYNEGTVWHDFLDFCAPMLYATSKQYLTAKSLTIAEKYDTDANSYLLMSMYITDSDAEGKLAEPYLAQARIYEGNRIFTENFTTSYYLVKGDTRLGKLVQNDPQPSDHKELHIKDVALAKGDGVKIWATDGQYYGATRGTWEHNLTVAISADAGLVDSKDNYVAVEAANYDFYVKFTNEWAYTGVYVKDQAARTIYCEANDDNINKDSMFVHYWGDDVVGSVWDYKPTMVYSHQSEFDKPVNKAVIPGATTNIQFSYNEKTGGAFKQSADLVLGTNDGYYWKDTWTEVTSGDWRHDVESYDCHLDHKYGDLVAEVLPDRKTAGNHDYYHCSVCGKYFDKDKNEIQESDTVYNANIVEYDGSVGDSSYVFDTPIAIGTKIVMDIKFSSTTESDDNRLRIAFVDSDSHDWDNYFGYYSIYYNTTSVSEDGMTSYRLDDGYLRIVVDTGALTKTGQAGAPEKIDRIFFASRWATYGKAIIDVNPVRDYTMTCLDTDVTKGSTRSQHFDFAQKLPTDSLIYVDITFTNDSTKARFMFHSVSSWNDNYGYWAIKNDGTWYESADAGVTPELLETNKVRVTIDISKCTKTGGTPTSPLKGINFDWGDIQGHIKIYTNAPKA